MCRAADFSPRQFPRQYAGASHCQDAGVSTVEMVILTPLLLGLVLLIVAFGTIVTTQGQVFGAARNAARAASLTHDVPTARQAAQRAAATDLGARCAGGPRVELASSVTEAGTDPLTVTVTCPVDLSGLTLFDFPSLHIVTGRSAAPLDTYRRFEGNSAP